MRCSTCGGILGTSRSSFQAKDHKCLQSGPAEVPQAVIGRLRGVLVPQERGTARPFSEGVKVIYCTFLSLNEGGGLIRAKCRLAFHRSIMMRCSARRPRCTKNGDRNDLMVVAPYHSVLRKYAEMRQGSGMREFTEK